MHEGGTKAKKGKGGRQGSTGMGAGVAIGYTRAEGQNAPRKEKGGIKAVHCTVYSTGMDGAVK